MAPSRPAKTSAKKQALTLSQLSSYDDILTDALVDRAYYWTTIPKNRSTYHPSRGVREEEITKIIQNDLIVKPDVDVAEEKLLATDGLRRFYNALKTPQEKIDFKQHLRRYMQIYLPECPFEVSSTNRYTVVTHEASVVARRFIKRNEKIKYLTGIQVLITPEEEAALSVRKKDFSIVVSSRNRMARLFMGPARFANHDCGANAKLVITGQACIDIVAVRSIEVGEEITVTYGESYFGEDNCECLCQTCEDNLVNGWKQPEGIPPVKKSIEEDLLAAQGYNTRGKRRYDRGDSRSRTPSVNPDIRPKVFKTKLKRLRDGDRASTTESALRDRSVSGLKRKADTEILATPPVTPAKKQKTLHYKVPPAHPLNSERSASSDAESGGITSRSESSSGEAILTDVTSPEDSTDAADAMPHATPISQAIEQLKQEQDIEEISGAGLASVAPYPGPVNNVSGPDPELETPRPPQRSKGLSIRDLINTPSAASTPEGKTPMDRFAAAFEAHGASEPVGGRGTQTVESQQAEIGQVVPSPSRAVVKEPYFEVIETEKYAVDEEASRGRSRTRSPAMPEKSSSMGTDLSAPLAIEPDTGRLRKAPMRGSGHREPRDYELTPRLLSEPDMAWVRCTNCNAAFVQQNAYYTRASCPRCERHSKLYGYVWPKTQQDGPWDKEERILDHRTIHRFLALDDELVARGRAPLKRTQTATPGRLDSASVVGRGRSRIAKLGHGQHERNGSDVSVGSDIRRSRRRRTASHKLAGDF